MANVANTLLFSGLAHRLVSGGILNETQVQQALEDSYNKKIPFVIYLVQMKLVPAAIIAWAAAQEFGIPLLDLNVVDTDSIPNKLVDQKLIQKYHAIPLFKRGNHLYLAISDPANQIAVDEIKFHTGLTTHAILVEEDKLSSYIDYFMASEEDDILQSLHDSSLDNLEITNEDEINDKTTIIDADDAPVVRFVHKILLDAIKKGASDIHFEPFERNYQIRFRLDGILYPVTAPPLVLANRITSRIKIMSQLDISEKRVPQDGRFKLNLSKKRSIDFRISTCPTVGGEKVVIRLLDPTAASLDIDALGFESFQKEIFSNTIHRSQGMILVTGPTGSGKTVSLYTALSIRNTLDVNICTVEDPVEINLPGINQVNINLKTGLTFATALRAFLRQDPDIIMVGEMRDLETAEIGIKAAQTGHLVFSTLHTNSAPETLTRLINMGVAPFNIATSVSLIIAQRLARRLCDRCKRKTEIPHDALIEEGFTETEIPKLELFEPVGCDDCTDGYKGRTGIYELLSVTPTISQAIMSGNNSLEIAKIAHAEGMQTLRESGLNKVREGLTSLTEINRITKD